MASDMAFPRLNALAYWVNVPGALLVVSSLFLGGFDTGWTGYPPLSARAPLGMQMFFLGVYLIGLSSILGSLNLVVTTVRMRAPGMSWFRMPIFVWASFATALIGMTATQLIGLVMMVMIQRLLGTWASSTRPRAAMSSCSSTCSGSRIRRCMCLFCRAWDHRHAAAMFVRKPR
ncbi:MAG: cbb3-type cytochrome c oxidase subunit I [Kouleothrix sp.]